MDAPKTRDMRAILTQLKASPSVLILLPAANENISRSARNLENVKTLRTNYLNVRDLLGYEIVVMSKDALTAVETFFDAENGGK
jgi:large subunit ribosomal protein L4